MLARLVSDLGWGTVAVVATDDSYASSLADVFAQRCESLGSEVAIRRAFLFQSPPGSQEVSLAR